jgi:homoserine kinase type II
VWVTPGPSKLLLRRYDTPGITADEIGLQHEVMLHLGRRSSIVAPPLQDTGGATFGNDDGRFWAVFPFIEGTAGATGRVAALQTAVALARLHQLLSPFQPSLPRRKADLLSTLATCRDVAEEMSADRTDGPIDWRQFSEICASAERLLANLHDVLPRRIVHGDVHPFNVIWQGAGGVGIIDFDCVHEAERMWDVAAIVDNYARPEPSAPIDPSSAAAILRAYDETEKLSSAERRSLGAFLVGRAAVKAVDVQADFENRLRKSALLWDRMLEAYDAWL